MILPLIWVACAIAAYIYSKQYDLPTRLALAVFPAFLLEITLFYVLGSERLRARLEKLPRPAIAFALVLAAAAPYCIATLTLGSFRWQSLAYIIALAATAAFWYVLLPHKPATDILFLILMAIVYIAKPFLQFYVRPHPRIPLETLGQLMWIRTGLMAMLTVRRVKGIGFGFWPMRREWEIGALYYALFVPVAAAVAWAIDFGKPHAPVLDWQRATLLAIGTFFGILWVVALAEEFLFRGLMQQWMTAWLSSEWAGLLITSLLFGSVHLWFRVFPNWRFAALASVAGLFYGLAFRQARSIRASMVAHALTVTTWRMFYS